MTYIDYLNGFNRWLESNALPGNAQLMYFKFLDVFNRAGWPEYVQVDNRRLMCMAEAGAVTTALRARDRLIEEGFLDYQKGRKGAPNRYRLKNATVSATISATENATISATHIKTKTKTKTKSIPPTPLAGGSPELQAAFDRWLRYKHEKRQDYTPTGLQSLVTQVQRAAQSYGDQAVADLIDACMANNWQGIIFDRLKAGRQEKRGGNIFLEIAREEGIV